MLGTGYFLKIAKINSKQNQSVLIGKISSRKTQKIANPQKKKKTRKNFVPHGHVVVYGPLLEIKRKKKRPLWYDSRMRPPPESDHFLDLRSTGGHRWKVRLFSYLC